MIAVSILHLHTGTETRFTGFGFPIQIIWFCVSSTRHADYSHCSTSGLDLTHCPGALSRSTAGSPDPDWGRVKAKWSLNPDSLTASDLDPRSHVHVESPNVDLFCSLSLSFTSLQQASMDIFSLFSLTLPSALCTFTENIKVSQHGQWANTFLSVRWHSL